MDLGRISVDHQIMGSVPCVAGTRIPVATIVGLVANGLTAIEIVAEYPQLTLADVQACLGYPARAVDERELPVRLTASGSWSAAPTNAPNPSPQSFSSTFSRSPMIWPQAPWFMAAPILNQQHRLRDAKSTRCSWSSLAVAEDRNLFLCATDTLVGINR
jgi:uncharacterized protein (DUF433 family)